MFKCAASMICISIESTCDEIQDCPNMDDEYLCSPPLPECPGDCHCLAYVIHCDSINTNLSKIDVPLPYILVSITNSKLTTFNHVLYLLMDTKYIFLSNTDLGGHGRFISWMCHKIFDFLTILECFYLYDEYQKCHLYLFSTTMPDIALAVE